MNKKKVMYIAIASVLAILLICACASFFLNKKATYTVIFQDYDKTVLKTETVKEGESATTPEEPKREGYTFFAWDKEYANITRDSIITAEYINPTQTSFVVDNVSISKEEGTAEVKVSVANNPGILGMVLSVEYDDDALTLSNCRSGDVLSALTFQEPSKYASGSKFVWYGSETGEVKDGEMLVLVFDITDKAEAKEYPITLSWNERDIYDSNCDMLLPTLVEGSILIQ